MANIFELNVNIHTTEKSEAQKALSQTIGNDDMTSGKSETLATKDNKTAAAVGAIAIQGVKQSASQIVSFEVNKISTIYGDDARANQINNMMNTASAGMSLVSSIATGASIGGPWGAVVGAVVGVATEAIGFATRAYSFAKTEQDRTRNSNYAQERLGLLAASKGR